MEAMICDTCYVCVCVCVCLFVFLFVFGIIIV